MARCIARRAFGFTLVELLVVMTVIGLLLSLAAPRYFEHVARAKEAVLKQNLRSTRDAIDKFYADRVRYPATLQELVQQKYLRELPIDPVTDRADTWVLLAPGATGGAGGVQGEGNSQVPGQGQPQVVFNLRSGAPGLSLDGSPYASW